MKTHFKAAGRRRAAQGLAAVLAFAAWQGRGSAPLVPPDLVSVRSQSGQFIVYAGRTSGSLPPLMDQAGSHGFVQLTPTLATVSCERIKQVLLRELSPTAPWRGTIYLVLHPARAASDTITITSERFKTGWQYRVDVPDVVDRSRYVRAIVQVLLVEMADRTAQARAAEVPLWLIEGFSQLLLASSEAEIILPPPRESARGVNLSATMFKGHKETLQEQARKKLRGRLPLTFEDLSWPADDQIAGDAGDLYSGSAQLFVGELLRLPDGRACLRAMLAQLPRHYNWQFAFLGAFHAHFERPLDVEKWWALARAEAQGRDPAQAWSLDESWQKLDQAIQASVQVRTGTNDLPLHARVSLQTIIRQWDTVRQTQALGDSLRELGVLRLRIAQEFVSLVQDYYAAIATYLQERDRSGSVLPFVRNASRRRAADAAVKQLDALDVRRQALRPAPKPVTTAQPPAAPAGPP
jgi:hypothetical protein